MYGRNDDMVAVADLMDDLYDELVLAKGMPGEYASRMVSAYFTGGYRADA